MSWRVVVITNRCKLETKLGYLVCRGEETKKIFLSEISVLVIESTAVSLTAALLCELIRYKVNVVFCDEKHNPQSQLNALYGRHDSFGQIRKQIVWDAISKRKVWTEIVRNKLYQQYLFLKQIDSERAEIISKLLSEVTEGDETNREGHAAKVYFNTLFGMEFKRGDETFINSVLNYGYAVILSAFNREIAACGYLTQLGVWHNNEFNPFNLSSDLMEPYRILVDRLVFTVSVDENLTEYKHKIVDVLNNIVEIDGKSHTVIDSIAIYCRSVFEAIDKGNVENIKYYSIK